MLELLAQYLPVLGPPIGIAIAWIWTEARKKKKEDALDVVDRERTYSERLEGRLKDREADIERLSKELLAARHNEDPEDVLKSIVDSDVGVSWVKVRLGPKDYRMLRVSLGYAKLLLKDAPESYDGKTDAQIWGAEAAAKFTANDEKVHTTQTGMHVVEKVNGGIFTGRKFPLHVAGKNYIVGIGNWDESNSN